MIVVKAGGSAITQKNKLKTPRLDVIKSLALQIKEAKKKIILVHGAGSFGHITAKKHLLHKGFLNERQKIAVGKTRLEVLALNQLILEKLIECNVPAFSLQPSACFTTKNGRIKKFFKSPIEKMFELNFLPVFYGDTVFDEEMGFCILSGDQIVVKLAKEFGAEKIIFGTNVDGIYTSNPERDKSARLLKEIRFSELGKILKMAEEIGDVSGGMLGKLKEIKNLGIEVDVVNLTRKNLLLKAIQGKVIGTKIF